MKHHATRTQNQGTSHRQHIHIIYKKNLHSVITTEKEVITAHAIIYSAQASHNIFRMQSYGYFKNVTL